ncbi:MAG: fibronectin type III domain-containing protein [Lachnospiraceae bacterium]|nr:fibronectin type III domain-containing protein [Lachnospiraceae bacterium]
MYMENDRKLTRTWGGLVLALALALICAFAAATTVHAEEAQGGSNMASAYTISAGTTYNDSFTDTTTADYFKVTLDNSGCVSFTVTAYMEKISLYMYDSSGNELYQAYLVNWDSTSGQSTTTFSRDLTEGTYYFMAAPSTTGTYTFSYSYTSAGETFAENGSGTNNTLPTASSISADTTYKGQLAYNDASDNYKFTIGSSGRVVFNIAAYIEKISFYLYDSDGNTVSSKTGISWNTTSGQSTTTITCDLTKGTYYFAVSIWNLYTGNYTFSYTFTSAGESITETGNGTNNSIAAASSISVGTTYKGQLALNDETDIYKFTASSDTYYDLSSTAYIEKVHYYIYDSSGNEVWKNTYVGWNSTIGYSLVEDSILLDAGTYYFAVTRYNSSTTGNYTFKISKHSHSYTTDITAATTSANGTITKTCSGCGYTKTSTIRKIKTVKLSTTTYTYNGKARKPTVTVTDSKGNTISSSYYTVKYASGRKNVGTYKVTVTFKGRYSGTVTKTFKINPKTTKISGLTAKSKGFKVTWSKVTTQTSGYQIQYATNKSFTSNKKTVTVSGSSKKTYTLSKLKASKKYYVRIRTYKTVSGTKYYSSWSSAKTVTTKK